MRANHGYSEKGENDFKLHILFRNMLLKSAFGLDKELNLLRN